MRANIQAARLSFGIENASDVSASEINATRLGLISFRLRTPLGEAWRNYR